MGFRLKKCKSLATCASSQQEAKAGDLNGKVTGIMIRWHRRLGQQRLFLKRGNDPATTGVVFSLIYNNFEYENILAIKAHR